jgi:hypothetical protein
MVAGPTGAQIGWAAGSMIGGAMFAPTQKSAGPRLDDLKVGTSQYGTPIPYVAGSPRIAGQIVWASAKREIATTQSAGGKGGGGSEYTSYTYEVDLLILLTDNQIAGVRRIWANGEVIWSAVASAGVATLTASANCTAWSRMTIYTGTPGQLPDPTYEAAVGTANAPAYRGRGAVFIQGYQLGSSGQIPNLTFEVVADGTITTSNVGDGLLCHFDEMNGAKVRSQLGPDLTAGTALITSPSKFGAQAGGAGSYSCTTATGTLNTNKSWRAEGWFYPTYWLNTYVPLFSLSDNALNSYAQIALTFQFGYLSYQFNTVTETTGTSGQNGCPSNGIATLNSWSHFAIEYNAITKQTVIFQNGYRAFALSGEQYDVGAVFNNISVGGANGYCDEFFYREIPNSELYGVVSDGSFAYTVPAAPFNSNNTQLYAIEPNTVTVQSVVGAITDRTGITGAQYSTTALSTITRPVRAMSISQVSSARTVLEMLASAYHFDAVLSDKIYFKPRGGSVAATLTFDEFGVAQDGQQDCLPLMTANELEIPAQLAITFSNTDGDYQTDTQYSDRLLTGQESTSAVTLPLGFTASEGKQIADALLLDKAVGALSTTVGVCMARTALEPTDVLVLTGDDSSTYRMRVVKRSEASGVITLDCVADDATVFTQSGTTSGGTGTQTTVAALATTTLKLLDIPLLNDAQDAPGLYYAVTGSAANWTGAAIYDSLDDVTYTQRTTASSQAPMGTCTTTLGAWTGGNTFDETNTVTVNVGLQQLVSVTWSDILANGSTNAALVGSELIQYRVATLVSAGVYTLSGLLRGRKGTPSTGHIASEQFVGLGTNGMGYLTLQAGDLARARYYKGVSASQALSAVIAQSITPLGNTLKPLAPVDARANRNATDTVITWARQTRLSTRIVGTLPMSIPLGEATEAYQVEVWDSGYTTLKRTLTSSTPTVTYTNANQVTDFGSGQTTIYLKIYQLSATVGRGNALTVSI